MRATIVVCLALSGVAFAKPAPKPTERKAKAHYEAGVAAYRAGDYAKAVEELEAGYALAPEPAHLYNLGQAHRLAGNPERALECYQRFLEEVPDAPNRAAVEQRIAEVTQQIEAKRAPPPPPPAEPDPTPPAPPAEPDPAPAPRLSGLTPHEIGVRVRGLFVPRSFFNPYLQAATSMESFSTGIEYVWKRDKFDVVTSLDFSWLPVKDGNYLANNHPANLDTKYVEFRNLSFLSADVSVIGHNLLTSWLEIRYGGGLGLGVVFGDVLVTNNWTMCTAENAENLALCHPQGVDLLSPNKEAQLKATEQPGARDTAQNPHRTVSGDKPPVMGVLNLLLGLRFYPKPTDKRWSLTVETGFRMALFAGVSGHFRF